MKLAVIGTGFVGVVSAAVFASLGHEVVGLDIDQTKVDSLNQGKIPFFEKNLDELLAEALESATIRFTTDYQEAIEKADVCIIAVGTPSSEEGRADLAAVLIAAGSMSKYLKDGSVVVIKSTVPPGTLNLVDEEIAKHTSVKYYLASVPEFLREGSAVQDTLHPDRVVIGADEERAKEILKELHEPFHAPILSTTPASAQMIKYVSNAYLATRITFINQVADLCEKNSADIQAVIQGIGYDKRIGHHYWYPGLGYGGSCFPKDVKELAYYSRTVGENDNLFIHLQRLNDERVNKLMTRFSKEVSGWQDKTIAVLGLSFKPGTDDLREAPSTKIIPILIESGAKVQAYDPQALDSGQRYFEQNDSLTFHQNIEKACQSADVIMLLIEWQEIFEFDYSIIRHENKDQYMIDLRNQLVPQLIEDLGFRYIGIGRTTNNGNNKN